MIDKKKILAFIPARGGSKGIKDKNILEINGKPLLAYTIEAAKNSTYIDAVLVSTDSEKIGRIAKEYGAWVPFLRPADLATDTIPTLDAVLYTINRIKEMGELYEYDILILLQPTSPLRSTEDIDNALRFFVKNACLPLAAVTEVTESPILMRVIGEDGYLKKLIPLYGTIRRQDMPSYYRLNGSIYINLISELDSHTSFNDNPIPFVMENSHSADIDDFLDLEIVKYYLHHI